MCGIGGIINYNSLSINQEAIHHLSVAIKHRGPDDEGYFLINETDNFVTAYGDSTPENVRKSNLPFAPKKHIKEINEPFDITLIHRRLAIIDTTASGHQPMSNNQRLWITYNGELYNYIELREYLQKLGHHFMTNSDTEVILNSYKEWGTKCVSKFNGMWAFAIYDANKKQLFLSRDRTGVKPLYYYNQNAFCFSSEIKGLLALPFVKKELNTSTAYDFLVFNELEKDNESLIKGIFELKPAHNLLFDLKTKILKTHRYYTPYYNNSDEPFDSKKAKEYSEAIKELVFDAVRLRLRSDVAYGSCLSGGIDSSSIVSIINTIRNDNNPTNLYTSCFTEKNFD